MGSYLLILRAEGFREVRYPVLIERTENWRAEQAVPLLTDVQIGEGFVYVPPGYSVLGGDPDAYQSWPRHERWLDGFCLAEREVTMAEWWAFLRACLADGTLTTPEAQAMVPRQAPQAGHYWQVRGSEVAMPQDWPEDWPVLGISWQDAQAYCAWRTAQDGRAISLPTEAEWERAARGADGRGFPWGDGFRWDRTIGLLQAGGGRRMRPERVLAAPGDVSPFGVRDLAGSMREWCEDEPADYPGLRAVRGGAWGVVESANIRGANRSASDLTGVVDNIGIRVRAAPRTR
jgi:serine/threonine-protein kinase